MSISYWNKTVHIWWFNNFIFICHGADITTSAVDIPAKLHTDVIPALMEVKVDMTPTTADSTKVSQVRTYSNSIFRQLIDNHSDAVANYTTLNIDLDRGRKWLIQHKWPPWLRLYPQSQKTYQAFGPQVTNYDDGPTHHAHESFGTGYALIWSHGSWLNTGPHASSGQTKLESGTRADISAGAKLFARYSQWCKLTESVGNSGVSRANLALHGNICESHSFLVAKSTIRCLCNRISPYVAQLHYSPPQSWSEDTLHHSWGISRYHSLNS